MTEKEKGCVYFFRHIGLSPVKIGYSANKSPFDRYESFKTYAPYGAQLFGFIICDEPNKLEKLIHQKYSNKRLSGEWFDLSEEEIQKCIDFYSKIEDITAMNNFQVAWAKENYSIKNNINVNNFYETYSFVKTNEFCNKYIIKLDELCEVLKCDKERIKEFLKSHNIQYSAHRDKDKVKKGYLLFIK